MCVAAACSVYDEPNASTPSGGGSANPSAGTAGSTGGRGGAAGAGMSSGAGIAGNTVPNEVGGSGGTGSVELGGAGGAPEPEDAAGQAGQAGEVSPPDACPSDPDKLAPGVCGCGLPDVATSTLSDCVTLEKKLTHRYDFEGSGTQVTDRIGTANGAVHGASLSKLEGKGVVLLGGGSGGSYVDLPNGLISTLKSVTLEAWITWGGGEDWQRVFDFGNTSNAAENTPGFGKTYLYLTPKASTGVARLGFSLDGSANEQTVDAPMALPLSLTQVVMVANDTANTLVLYANGKRMGSVAWTSALSDIGDVNVWLGRSQWDQNPEFSGVFHEFRVYGSALTDADVAAAFRAGTDPAFLRD